MTNIFPLFRNREIQSGRDLKPEPAAKYFVAVAELQKSFAKLNGAVNELSNRLDGIDRTVEALDESEAVERIRSAVRLQRECLILAMHELSSHLALLTKAELQ